MGFGKNPSAQTDELEKKVLLPSKETTKSAGAEFGCVKYPLYEKFTGIYALKVAYACPIIVEVEAGLFQEYGPKSDKAQDKVLLESRFQKVPLVRASTGP